MMPRPGREGAEVIAPRHAKSPVVEVSPNGHAGAGTWCLTKCKRLAISHEQNATP